jgi:hypothetical protein
MLKANCLVRTIPACVTVCARLGRALGQQLQLAIRAGNELIDSRAGQHSLGLADLLDVMAELAHFIQ